MKDSDAVKLYVYLDGSNERESFGPMRRIAAEQFVREYASGRNNIHSIEIEDVTAAE